MELDKNRQACRSLTETRPIKFHSAFGNLESTATSCGCTSHELIEATEEAIRLRHHEAVVEPYMQAVAQGYDIFEVEIRVGNVERVGYTVEPDAVVIRGFRHRRTPERGSIVGVFLLR